MAGKYQALDLGTVSAAEDGSAVEVAHLEDVAVSVSGTFSGTCELQVSFDGTNWAPHPTLTGKTAAFSGAVGFPCKQIRLTVTAYTSGDFVGAGAGKDADRLG